MTSDTTPIPEPEVPEPDPGQVPEPDPEIPDPDPDVTEPGDLGEDLPTLDEVIDATAIPQPLPPLPRPIPADSLVRVNSVGESQIEYRVGGRQYAQRSVHQCKTCRSPYRSFIENSLLKGYSYRTIESHLPDDAKITWRNIQDHKLNNHLPIDESVRRVIIERRAEELGLDPESYESGLADHVTLIQLGVQEAIRRFTEGTLEMTMDHALQFIAAAMRLEMIGGVGMDRDAAHAQYIRLFAVMRDVLTPEQFAEISERMKVISITDSPAQALERRSV